MRQKMNPRDRISSTPTVKRGAVVSRTHLYALAVSIFYFIFTIEVMPFYDGGDQFAYRHFYENIKHYGFWEGIAFFKNTLGTVEPGYYLVAWIFSGFLPKDVIVSAANSILAYMIFFWLFKKRINILLIALLSMNYYLIVLLFSAERLKFSLLFLAFASFSKPGIKVLFMSLSVSTHLQTLLLIVSYYSEFVVGSLRSFFCRGIIKRNAILAAVPIAFFLVILIYLREHIIRKFGIYNERFGGMYEFIPPFVFMALSLFYSRRPWAVVVAAFLPIIFAAILVGDERITIFAYFIFLFFSISFRGGVSLGVMATSLYFFVKGFIFIGNIYQHGNGFYNAAF